MILVISCLFVRSCPTINTDTSHTKENFLKITCILVFLSIVKVLTIYWYYSFF